MRAHCYDLAAMQQVTIPPEHTVCIIPPLGRVEPPFRIHCQGVDEVLISATIIPVAIDHVEYPAATGGLERENQAVVIVKIATIVFPPVIADTEAIEIARGVLDQARRLRPVRSTGEGIEGI